ncbi:MAG TPA: ABC transporter, partial [Cytophagales bacterium]|nr:ABC transporter [Cytophagales bacterium]
MLENFREGLRSIKANMLRSVLTAVIVTFGITALVGSLTAVDGIGVTLNESLASLGANTFDIGSKQNRGTSLAGIKERVYKPLQLNEVQRFMDQFNVRSNISLSANLSFATEVKHGSKKTNPNISVTGINDDYMYVKSLNFELGRNFSKREIEYGAKAVVLGKKVYDALYENNEDFNGT